MPTEFEKKVYEITKRIPKGKVSTYKQIAQAMNSKAYRAVGQALHKNPYSPKVPCHRVVRSDGSLGGFALGQRKKAEMLRKEGVIVKKNRVNLKKFLFKEFISS
ncbi:MGMT family protein [Candidatus Woesearchaeota archaeon]|nr:MAG: MGMT family protein [Candidatus Woesearchaeota archaeon]